MRKVTLVAGVLAMIVAGCSQVHSNQGEPKPVADQAKTNWAPTKIYAAVLHPLNSNITGLKTSGEARFVVRGDQVRITIDVKNAPANMEHWQHFHGFKDNRPAVSATSANDANGDGVIDVVETEAASGTTMVPFNADPVRMDVAANTYPRADANGNYHYQVTVSLDALRSAFARAFDGQMLDLGGRVLYIHGVPADTQLPASVASLGDIPAQVTLPIACGEIRRVDR